MGAYPEIYLHDAMDNMGEMLEYSERGCGMAPGQYLEIFAYSRIGHEWSRGNPVYICGRSGTELCLDVMEECGCHYEPTDIGLLNLGETYWCGWILAYYQWKRGGILQNICQKISFQDLLQLYPAGHTASEDRACEMIDALILRGERRKDSVTRLHAYRKRLGMSQSELAKESGVNLRTLQEYEVGRKSLSQAAAVKVIRLADILQIRPEELLESEESITNDTIK